MSNKIAHTPVQCPIETKTMCYLNFSISTTLGVQNVCLTNLDVIPFGISTCTAAWNSTAHMSQYVLNKENLWLGACETDWKKKTKQNIPL